MTLKWLYFFQEIAIIAQRLGAFTPAPLLITLELHQFGQHAAQLQHFLNRIILTFGSSPLAKFWLQPGPQSEIFPVGTKVDTGPPILFGHQTCATFFLSDFFCPKLGEEQKKRSSLKFSPIFCPKLHEEQKNKTKGLH